MTKAVANSIADAAIGLRSHSGWAALVVLARAPDSSAVPIVVYRRRIDLADSGTSGPTQPYHAAEHMGLKDAEQLITRCADRAKVLAKQALTAIMNDLGGRGYKVVGCGILLGSGRPATSLAATLASHALIHAAEGELFRNALAHAGEDCGLPVTGVKEKTLYEHSAQELRLSADELHRHVAAMGRAIGPPWRQDEKLAALVGWLSLTKRVENPSEGQRRHRP